MPDHKLLRILTQLRAEKRLQVWIRDWRRRRRRKWRQRRHRCCDVGLFEDWEEDTKGNRQGTGKKIRIRGLRSEVGTDLNH
jgi:hypothetical protein